MPTRKYQQRLRAETADQTRRAILDALYDRLREAPTEPVSIERVATMAGVSRSTVYLVFGSRAELFDALGDDLRERGGFARIAAAAQLPDARQALLEGIRASVPAFAAHRDVLRVLYSMAQLDAEAVGGAIQRMGEARATGLAWHVERLVQQGDLREDLTADEAVHLLWALTGFEFFDQLHTGRDLPLETVADFMAAAAERAVLRQP